VIVKVALIGALIGAASSVVDDTALRIAGLAAGAAGLRFFYRSFLKPAAELLGHAVESMRLGVQIFRALPDWMAGVDQRLGGLEAKAAGTHEPMEAIARELGVQHRTPEPSGPPGI
jgi:hypothetical protein